MTIVDRPTSPSDIISELPSNIIENILVRLPLQDAMRTSILSSKWRYKWLTIPQLAFDYPSDLELQSSAKAQLVIAVYQALLIHRGPLRKFSFSVSDLGYCSDVNHWLHFLSKNSIQDFTLRIWTGEQHKLPCHFYSFLQLRHLNLHNCIFKPPSTFKGFSHLVSLEFWNVFFVAERFGIFISNCPKLEQLILEGCPHFFCLRINAPNLKHLSFPGTFNSIHLKSAPLLAVVSIALNGMAENAKYFKDGKPSNLIGIVSSLPAVEKLSAELYFLKFLAIGSVQKGLPRNLDHLKVLHLFDVGFEKKEEVSCALCLIISSPNLQKLIIRASTNTTSDVEPVVEYLEVQNFSDCSLNKLQEIKMLHISGTESELEFMKLLLATSPALEKVEMLPIEENSVDKGFQILRELIRFRRASPKAEIVYLDPEESNEW